MSKTDSRKRIPIPADIQTGDVLVLRDGQKRTVIRVNNQGEIGTDGPVMPYTFLPDGRSWAQSSCRGYHVVAIERKDKATEPKPAKPDRDAVWLYRLAVDGQTQKQGTLQRRLHAIARRLNGGKAVTP